ncbi:MAG TPA: sulfate ABC transporter permease subunit [Actinomycetota bacterium]|nr:sulfate ABC transporter permease subunit [Actinomycetota bacterium]
MSVTSRALVAGAGRRRLVRGSLMGLALAYIGVLLILPVAGIVIIALRPGWQVVSDTFGSPQVRHAYYLTGIITAITVVVTAFFGVLVAWVLTRDRFPGRSIMNALVDLPFAVSPVTVGVMAVLLFGRGGWFEPFFSAAGIQIIYALPSMVLVTIFISIPFVIRAVVPILDEVGRDEEEAARTLGASLLQSFLRVTLPNIRWGLAYGVALSAARALGEIGAVLIVSGAIQGQTETATLYVFTAIEERLDASGYLVALSLAGISVVLLAGIELFKRRQAKEVAA